MDHVKADADAERVEPNGQQQRSHVGLLGLGDGDYPLQRQLFSHFASQPKFLKTGAAAWCDKHSEPHACNAVEPPSTIFRQCCSFCVKSACAEMNIDLESDEARACRGLLFHINRHMRDLYAGIKKQIDKDSKHPLLFVRVLQPNGIPEWRAWLLTRAVFKPRFIDSIAVYPTSSDSDSLETPFVVKLASQQVAQSEYTIPKFVCMSELIVEMTTFAGLFPDAQLQYAYNPPYELPASGSLTELRVTEPLRWIPVDARYADEGDSGDEGDDDEAELVEIDEMLDCLSSLGVQRDEPKRKDQKRTTMKGKDGPKKTTQQSGPNGRMTNNLQGLLLMQLCSLVCHLRSVPWVRCGVLDLPIC